MTLRDCAWGFLDWVLPMRRPRTAAELTAIERRRQESDDAYHSRLEGLLDKDLANGLSDVKELAVAEEDRRKSVDARLTAMLGFASLAATVVCGTILTGSAKADSTVARVLLGCGSFYVALQVLMGINAAVRGMSRRGYLKIMPLDVLPLPDETPHGRDQRQLHTLLTSLQDSYASNDEKVTYMAVAHQATSPPCQHD